MASSKLLLVLTTTPSRPVAIKIGEKLLRTKLAASVQISGPIRSTYRWRGKVRKAEEWTCSIRTTPGKYRRVEKSICRSHPYEVPEIVAIKACDAPKSYLKWLKENLE